MDSISQIVLGAGVGEAILGKKIGNKSILWGAILGTVPDLDVIPTLFMDTVDKMSFHRGFSHSILFCLLAAPLFAWLILKLYKKKEATWREWTVFSFWVLVTHPLLDSFTTWGTQLFWPINYRVALNSIFIIDPLYTVPFLITIVWLMFYNRTSQIRKRINYAGLIISTTYLILTLVNKQIVDNVFKDAFDRQNINYIQFSSKPTPLNTILWTATAEVDKGFYLGFYSLLDNDKEIQFKFIEKNHELLSEYRHYQDLQRLLYLMKGYYSVEPAKEGILLHDLRFGQSVDMKTGENEFVFSFLLEKTPGDHLMITQKMNDFRDIESELFSMLWNRMIGNKENFNF